MFQKSRLVMPVLVACLLPAAALAQPRHDCNDFANDMIATGQRGQQARCPDFSGFNMSWDAHRNWCSTRNAFRAEAELNRWRQSLDRCLASVAPTPPQPQFPPQHQQPNRPGGTRWIPGNGQSCDVVCRNAGMRGLRSGNYLVNGGDSGQAYYVCAGDAQGWRPGYNLRPGWADTCIVAAGGNEIRTDRYNCACE